MKKWQLYKLSFHPWEMERKYSGRISMEGHSQNIEISLVRRSQLWSLAYSGASWLLCCAASIVQSWCILRLGCKKKVALLYQQWKICSAWPLYYAMYAMLIPCRPLPNPDRAPGNEAFDKEPSFQGADSKGLVPHAGSLLEPYKQLQTMAWVCKSGRQASLWNSFISVCNILAPALHGSLDNKEQQTSLCR